LKKHIKDRRRVLVGFDFPYGYPTGFASTLGLPTGPQSWWVLWTELAHRVQDTGNNASNRFAAAGELNAMVRGENLGPFWGRPAGTEIPNLEARSPRFPYPTSSGVLLQKFRIVESRLQGTQEAWKLFGAGSVGSQALVGIPRIYRLRRNLDLVAVSRVWPFETQFTTTPSPSQGPFILHAEIWPGVVKQRTQDITSAHPGIIRDQAQVRAMCEWAAECDEQGTLGQFFGTPNGLNPQQVQDCIQEEGWVLGAR
jgi:hypothetical protein